MNDISPQLGIVVLAAGKGTRMNSDMPKVLHHIAGKSMLAHVLETSFDLQPEKVVVVAGYQAQKVKDAFAAQERVTWVVQKPMLGTGHAVQFSKEAFAGFQGNIMVLYGDVPAVSKRSLQGLVDAHVQANALVTLLTAELANPTGYGRIIKNEQGQIVAIVEEKDASAAQKKVRLINTGIAVYDAAFLMEAVFELSDDNEQREYYLTDVVEHAVERGHAIASVVTDNPMETFGVNDPQALKTLEDMIKNR